MLYDHGASLVLSGHDHDYERFAPQDPSGRSDPKRGIRQFIVGTGGASLGSFNATAPNSEVRNNRAYGVLELTLRPDGYDWRFVPTAGESFTDSGSDTCKGTALASSAPPTTVAPASPPPAEETPAPTFETFDDPEAPPSTTKPVTTSPPASGRRRPTATTAPARPAAPAARPRAAAPAPTMPAVSDPAPFEPVPPATFELPPTTVPAPPPTAPLQPDAAEPAAAPDDTASLALALSGLIERAPPDRPDRRAAVASFAILLVLADGAALAALHRRRRGLGAAAYG